MTSEQIELIADWRKGKHSSGAYYADDDHFNPLLATTSSNVGELTMPGLFDVLDGIGHGNTISVCRMSDSIIRCSLHVYGERAGDFYGEAATYDGAIVAAICEWLKREA